jgi:hypothetical protein
MLNNTATYANAAQSRRTKVWIERVAAAITALSQETVDIAYAASCDLDLKADVRKPSNWRVPVDPLAGGRALLEVLRHEYIVWTEVVPAIAKADLVANEVRDIQFPLGRAQLLDLREKTDFDECVSLPCLHGGVCENIGVRDIWCSCPPQYRGDTCQIAILMDSVWIQTFFMEVTCGVCIFLIAIPVFVGVKRAYDETTDAIEGTMHALAKLGTKKFEVGTLEAHIAEGFTPLPALFGEEGDIDPSSIFSLPPGMEEPPPQRPRDERKARIKNPMLIANQKEPDAV